MFRTKRVAGALGVIAGVALIGLTGPAASADETTLPDDPCATVDTDDSATTLASVRTFVAAGKPENPGKPDNPGSNGKGSDKSDKGDKDRDRTQDQDCDEVQDQTKDQTRAELRDEIRANGGSWGAYQRQDALIRVASKLAERYGATPENTNAASLGRILTLVNSGLPEALQIDVEMFLAQYELSLSDIRWPVGEEPEPTPEPSPSPSPEPSVSPTVSPSASPSLTPSVSPTA